MHAYRITYCEADETGTYTARAYDAHAADRFRDWHHEHGGDQGVEILSITRIKP